MAIITLKVNVVPSGNPHLHCDSATRMWPLSLMLQVPLRLVVHVGCYVAVIWHLQAGSRLSTNAKMAYILSRAREDLIQVVFGT